MQALDLTLHGRAVLQRRDFRELRLERLHAESIDARLIHAACIEVAGELIDAAFGCLCGLGHGCFENDLELILVSLSGCPASAPARHGRRNRVRGAPRTIGVREEIVAGLDAAIEVANLDATLCSVVAESRAGHQYEDAERRY